MSNQVLQEAIMARLKTIYDTQDEIPEGYADLYTERNGRFELTGIEGVKTQADIDRVQSALVKERTEHKATKAAFAPFEGLDPDQISANQTALEEARAQLEAINKDGRVDETKLEPIIAARIKQAVSPLERDKQNLERQLDAQRRAVQERETEVNNLRSSITSENIERAVRDAATLEKVLPTALDDVSLRGSRVFEKTEDGRIVTKDVPGVVPGLTPREWLKDMQEKAPHWWPASVGGGSQGGSGGRGTYGGANNPWSKAGWSLTKQGALVRQLGEAKAAEIAAQVGSFLGATKPSEAA
jgi:hypothetical protein